MPSHLATEMMASLYSALPLRPGEHLIRLITILPSDASDPEAPINCTMETVSLRQDPQFTALSYVWGKADDPVSVIVNGLALDMTQNLSLALKSIRNIGANKSKLWVDAICINQKDVGEKAGQIPMMGDIYRKAERVICWLGEDLKAAENLRFCLEMLEEASRAQQDPDYTDKRFGLAVLGLGAAEYWKRTWIVQEVIQAKSPVLLAQDVMVPWTSISAYIMSVPGEHNHLFYEKEDGVVKTVTVVKIPQVMKELVRARHAWGERDGCAKDLLSTMNRHLGWNATDPRDKLWGFLGIATDTSPLTRVDYLQPVDKVYHSFATSFIKAYNSLRILQAAGGNHSPDLPPLGLPSWVPDWRFREEEDRALGSDGKLYAAARDTPAQVELSNDERVLSVRGVVVGIVSHTRESNRRESSTPTPLEWLVTTLGGKLIPIDYVTGMPLLQAFSRTVLLDRFEKSRKRLGNSGPELLERLLHFYIYLKDLHKLKETFIVLDEDIPGYLALQGMKANDEPFFLLSDDEEVQRRAMLGSADSPGSISLDGLNQVRPYDGAIAMNALQWYNIYGRSLFITEKGHIGLGAEDLKATDLICVLFGCNVPIALRLADDHYEIVGECFIQGFMDGEALDMLDRKELEEQTFRIH